MPFPRKDLRNYTTHINSSKSISKPIQVFVVYYQGESGDWIWSLPTFTRDESEFIASKLNRPVQILTYDLTHTEDIQNKKRRIRRVRKPVMPKNLTRIPK